MSDLYILGAGFSKAISPVMPVVSELSALLDRYGTTAIWESEVSKLVRKDFEAGLSYLAENKPFLSTSENLRHRHLLLDLTRNLAMHLGIAQAQARQDIADGKADWMRPLVAHWIDRRVNLITLNYDTLVEELALRTTRGGTSYRAYYPPTLVPATARGGSGGFSSYADHAPVFGLFKLHGSLNWYHSDQPEANTDTVYFVSGEDVPGIPGGRAPAFVADKVPLIVPPLPVKGSLIHHDTMRAMWREAADAVCTADRIFVLGYSMPAADRLLVQLIRGRLFSKTPPVEIVDLNPHLGAHVATLFQDERVKVTQRFSGVQAIADFVAHQGFAPVRHSTPQCQ